MLYNNDNEYAHLQLYPWSKMNNGLYCLYNKYKKEVWDCDKFFTSHDNYELPYLIAASKNYENAPHRIMVIAQETRGWGSEFSHHNNYNPIDPRDFELKDYDIKLRKLTYPDDILKALMLLYDERVNKEWGPGGLLWDFYDNLRSGLEKQAPYIFGLIHNNIAKIANKSGEETDGVRSDYSINEPLIEMIKAEISITDPNVIIFCVGNDSHYQKLLNELNPHICNLTKKLSAANVITNIDNIDICNKIRKVICCYHPRRLNFEKGGLTITTNRIISLLNKEYNVSIKP